jgi:chromosome partitioning protein
VSRVFTLANNKGGISKTTTTVNLGRGLAKRGKRTLIVDMDAQSNTTWSILQKVFKYPRGTIYEAIMKRRPLHELICPTDDPNLFIVPSSLWMSYADAKLLQDPYGSQKLRIALKPYVNKFDYILIDTPPNLALATQNALFACTDVIIPITLNGYSLVGISILLNTIKELKTSAEENDVEASMHLFGVVVTQTRDTRDAADYYKQVQEYFGDLVLTPSVPLNVKVEQANNQGSLYDLYPDSTGAQAYTQVTQAILEREQLYNQDLPAYYAKTQAILSALPEDEEEQEGD